MNKQIQAYQSIALSAGRETPVGKQALKQASDLRDRYIDIQNETKRLADDQKNLQGVIQIGSTVVAGYGAVQSAMALTGVESEELRETMTKLMAAQTLLNSVNQIATALEKESSAMLLLKSIRTKVVTSSLYAYATAQGVATKGLKLFRIALISTGIGAIVVALGLLVANFSKVSSFVSNAIKKFDKLSSAMKLLLLPIMPLIGAFKLIQKGLEAIGVIESEEDEERQARHEAQMRRITQEMEAQKRAFKARQEQIDREIALNEALGKNTFELRQEQTREQIEQAKKTLEANKFALKNIYQLSDSMIIANKEQIDKLKDTIATAQKEILDGENKLKLNIINNEKDIDKSRKESSDKATQYQNDRLNALRKIEDIENSMLEDGVNKELDINADKFRRLVEDTKKNTKLTRTERNRLIELYEEQGQKKAQEIRDKYAQKELDAERKLQQQLEKERNDFEDRIAQITEDNWQMANMTQEEREIQAVKDKYFTLETLAQDNADALSEIQIARMNEENDIYLKYQKEREDADEVSKQAQIDRENNLRETRISLTASAFDALSQVVSSFNTNNERDAKKQFKITKALNLASAVTNTALAVTGALTAGGNPIKLATGQQFVEAGIAGAMGLANIVKIASAKFEGGGSTGGASTPSGAVSTPSVPNFNIVGNNNINQLAEIQGQPTKAYVVSDEVTTAQALDRKAQDFATL